MRAVLLILTMTMLAGCGWSSQCTSYRSYNLGEEITVPVGSALVASGCFALRHDPRGLTKVIFRRKSYKVDDFVQTVDKELLYSGRDAKTLHITYREYSDQGFARTPFFQQLFYDVGKSEQIVFQDWVIKIVDSSNERIKFIVVKEPPRPEVEPPVI